MKHCHLDCAVSPLLALSHNPLLIEAFSDIFVSESEGLIEDLFKELASS